MPLLGAATWAGGVAGTLARGSALAVLLGVAIVAAVAVVLVGRRRAGLPGAVVGLLVVAVAAAGVATLRAERVAHNPVAALAAQGAAVTVLGTVSSDSRTVSGSASSSGVDQVVWRLTVRELTGRGQTVRLRAPVLVLGSADDAPVALGATVRLQGSLVAADDRDLAGLLRLRGDPETVDAPDVWWRGAAAVRTALRDSVAHRPADQRALVPALVDGDDGDVDPVIQEAFRATGLTHLLAVSGTNLTLLVGFLLALARLCRVRGRWLQLVAVAGIVGFVLIARTEPSVLRAAVMGTIGLVALGVDGRHRALRGLGTAVVVLVLIDPALAVSAGFALSVLATGGILLLAPAWRDALARWLPRWFAEAIAVPAAAQLACTPLVAAISGQVSVVAVVANLLVAPVVGPATVLGLAGGLLTLVWGPLGQLCGTLACWCVAWLITVAEHGAGLPGAAVGWGTGPVALVLLTLLTVVVALVGPRLLRRPATGGAAAVVLVVAVAVRPPAFGWPPDGWVLVACDVGQGDALALNAGPGQAVVIDTGPDPRAVDRCLDRLHVEQVPLLMLTHFHADHVDGIGGVFDGREVTAVQTTRLLDPPGGVQEVDEVTAAAGVPASPVTYGASYTIGALTLQVLWPLADSPVRGPGDGSTANQASVVLLVETAGLWLLLTGDVEPDGQAQLARLLPELQVDVLKLPHHGSAHQDEPWLVSLDPDVVLVSVGADNNYGHPAASAMGPLEEAGAQVFRTDLDGDLAVVVDQGAPRVATSR
ncbi:MAG TPA: competence protein ComEC [Nocardioides bacterium]|nr:competence protein ComEC [Nocardioides sp.]